MGELSFYDLHLGPFMHRRPHLLLASEVTYLLSECLRCRAGAECAREDEVDELLLLGQESGVRGVRAVEKSSEEEILSSVVVQHCLAHWLSGTVFPSLTVTCVRRRRRRTSLWRQLCADCCCLVELPPLRCHLLSALDATLAHCRLSLPLPPVLGRTVAELRLDLPHLLQILVLSCLSINLSCLSLARYKAQIVPLAPSPRTQRTGSSVG
mmetsp:Transcript_3610/g.12747  ORF Transcript_3610/g.12747 Transcript_3610/m.12747 type:complete len:210 (-) Transcript_3610:258-887(-)